MGFKSWTQLSKKVNLEAVRVGLFLLDKLGGHVTWTSICTVVGYVCEATSVLCLDKLSRRLFHACCCTRCIEPDFLKDICWRDSVELDTLDLEPFSITACADFSFFGQLLHKDKRDGICFNPLCSNQQLCGEKS